MRRRGHVLQQPFAATSALRTLYLVPRGLDPAGDLASNRGTAGQRTGHPARPLPRPARRKTHCGTCQHAPRRGYRRQPRRLTARTVVRGPTTTPLPRRSPSWSSGCSPARRPPTPLCSPSWASGPSSAPRCRSPPATTPTGSGRRPAAKRPRRRDARRPHRGRVRRTRRRRCPPGHPQDPHQDQGRCRCPGRRRSRALGRLHHQPEQQRELPAGTARPPRQRDPLPAQ